MLKGSHRCIQTSSYKFSPHLARKGCKKTPDEIAALPADSIAKQARSASLNAKEGLEDANARAEAGASTIKQVQWDLMT